MEQFRIKTHPLCLKEGQQTDELGGRRRVLNIKTEPKRRYWCGRVQRSNDAMAGKKKLDGNGPDHQKKKTRQQ